MDNISDKWAWSEISNEEWKEMDKISNYYRIFHIDKKTKKEVNDFKFWAKNDNRALITLNDFKKDHADTKLEYFYSSSGYYWTEKERFDSMEEMHENFKRSPYDESDRKYDIAEIVKFKKDILDKKRNKTVEKLQAEIDDLQDKLNSYVESSTDYVNALSNYKLENEDEKTLDKLRHDGIDLNEKYYSIEDTEYLLKNKHNRSEGWDLYAHILSDIIYNVKILKKDKFGVPHEFVDAVQKEMKKVGNLASKEHQDEATLNKAKEMWNAKLDELTNHVLLHNYYSDFGIVDPKDKDLVNIEKLYADTIPYEEGTNKEIDYKKLHELTEVEWNAIWDWMKKYGYCLWS